MAKKKSRSVKIMKAAPPKVEKVFDCPFCQNSKTVEIRL
jgi:transcription elongation factor Elf1